MSKKWTEEEKNLIYKLRKQNETYNSIAIKLGTNRGALSMLIGRMRKEDKYKDIISVHQWTEKNTTDLIELRSQGKNNKQIAETLGIKHDTIKKRASNLIRKGELIANGHRGFGGNGIKIENYEAYMFQTYNITVEDLLDKVRECISKENCPPPYANCAIQMYGSWTKALEAAGISGNPGGKMLKGRLTTVYLLYFTELDIYKVGITQQQVRSRFAGAPKYKLLDSLTTSLEEALYFEKELLKSVKDCARLPNHGWFYRNGRTECFYKQGVKSLEDLL